jgi:hypothetical protein
MTIAKRLLIFTLFVVFAWLNLRPSWHGLFSGSRGFPFAFETWTDVLPSARIHLWALTADLLIVFGIIAMAAGIQTKRKLRISRLERP